MTASLVYIAVNVVLNILFVHVLRLEAFGLALSSSLGLWVFFAMQAQYFLSSKSSLRFRLKNLKWREGSQIVRIGLPGAAGSGYETINPCVCGEKMITWCSAE